jgi:hypothetical protein
MLNSTPPWTRPFKVSLRHPHTNRRRSETQRGIRRRRQEHSDGPDLSREKYPEFVHGMALGYQQRRLSGFAGPSLGIRRSQFIIKTLSVVSVPHTHAFFESAIKPPVLNWRPLSAGASRNATLSPPQPERVGHPVLAFLEAFSSQIRDRHGVDSGPMQSASYFPENNLHTTRGGNPIPSVPEAPPGWDTFSTDASPLA